MPTKMTAILVSLSLLVISFSFFASAYDPSPLQDFCVAIDKPRNEVFVNGRFCKDPKKVKAEDFFFTGLHVPRDVKNIQGSNVTIVDVKNLPGLNTMGISIARLDYAPYGQTPPHTHPRATEILTCLDGTLYVAFISSNDDGNRLFSKILHPGDVFVFPSGMIHFQVNIGKTKAVALAGLSSQDPGGIIMADAVFGSIPPINPESLARAFQLKVNTVEELEEKFRAMKTLPV